MALRLRQVLPAGPKRPVGGDLLLVAGFGKGMLALELAGK